jgi:hypothetical protein
LNQRPLGYEGWRLCHTAQRLPSKPKRLAGGACPWLWGALGLVGRRSRPKHAQTGPVGAASGGPRQASPRPGSHRHPERGTRGCPEHVDNGGNRARSCTKKSASQHMGSPPRSCLIAKRKSGRDLGLHRLDDLRLFLGGQGDRQYVPISGAQNAHRGLVLVGRRACPSEGSRRCAFGGTPDRRASPGTAGRSPRSSPWRCSRSTATGRSAD